MTDRGLQTRRLGRTGLEVTRLGYGAMSLDAERFGHSMSSAEAGAILNAVLDAGINFIDTSPDYGPSEQLIGEHIAGRREEYILASKCGCPVSVTPGADGRPAPHVYTRENVIAGVEQSLRRMRTDYLDLVQFHGSPAWETLEAEGAVEALRELQQAGRLRFIGMSGVLPALSEHIASGAFDAVQIPYSALQRDHEAAISAAAHAQAGTVIRGGVARGAPSEDKDWDIRRLPEVPPERPRELWEAAHLDDLLDGTTRMAFMLRFTLSHPDADTTIVGTSNPAHLEQNLAALRLGPLPADVRAEALRRLDQAAGA
ncbi:MAG: aldo/keto reductase [Chloroflexi bacterium]|nr:aldo/keto reductase [Chloroflexota bacterium]MDA1003452.1 aldo/keto reductase [Chloroflexota bacterium]